MHLDEAYERLHRYGPEFGGDDEGNHGMTNHGPMAVEVMLRRGLDVDVTRWVDRYVGRLVELPPPSRPIGDWTRALGDDRRLPDWQVFFAARLAEHSWTDVLATWWPRLLPGIAAGSTHGVIRVGHAVRALRAGAGDPARDELAHGLAFWAARYLPLPRRSPARHAAVCCGAGPRRAAGRPDRLHRPPGGPAGHDRRVDRQRRRDPPGRGVAGTGGAGRARGRGRAPVPAQRARRAGPAGPHGDRAERGAALAAQPA